MSIVGACALIANLAETPIQYWLSPGQLSQAAPWVRLDLAGLIHRRMIERSEGGLAEIGLRYAIYNVACSLLSAGAWAKIVTAIFR